MQEKCCTFWWLSNKDLIKIKETGGTYWLPPHCLASLLHYWTITLLCLKTKSTYVLTMIGNHTKVKDSSTDDTAAATDSDEPQALLKRFRTQVMALYTEDWTPCPSPTNEFMESFSWWKTTETDMQSFFSWRYQWYAFPLFLWLFLSVCACLYYLLVWLC